MNFSLTTHFIRKYYFILFISYCPVKSISVPLHKIFFYFNEIVSVFATILLWKPFLLNCLWIDLLQIGTGTDWLNSFNKSCKLHLWSCFTSLISVCSPCLLVDLGWPVHGLFCIFPHCSNLFNILDTADWLFLFIHPGVAVIPAVFWSGAISCFSSHLGNFL